MYGKLVVAACSAGRPFAEKVVEVLNKHDYPNLQLLDMEETRFKNGEYKTVILESVRGSDFYLIQDCETKENNANFSSSWTVLKTALGAARTAAVERKNLVQLVYPASRQDRTQRRECLTAADYARELERVYHVKNFIYMDVHNKSAEMAFDTCRPMNLSAVQALTEEVKNTLDVDMAVFADLGGANRVGDYAGRLNLDIGGYWKIRDVVTGEILETRPVGSVAGRKCLIVEDMVDTGGTLETTIRQMHKDGALSIDVIAPHALLNGKGPERMRTLRKEGLLGKAIFTDSVYQSPKFKIWNDEWFKQVSVASYVAKVIHEMHTAGSITGLLND